MSGVRIFRKTKPAAQEQRSDESYDLSDPIVALILGGMGATVAGENVTPETALRCSSAFACIRIVSETLAQLTPHLYRKKGDDDRERATDHPAYKLVAKAANSWTSASEFRLIVGTHYASVGNGYAFIGRDTAGRPAELIPLDARLVAVKQDPLTLEPIYTVTTPDGQTRDYSRTDIFHVRGVGLDVYKGASTITLAREAIGLALTLEKHCAGLFGRGAKPSGILKHPKTLTDKVFSRIRASFNNWYVGGANAGKTMILEDGVEFQQLQLSSVDSQTLEMRRFQIAEISRYWRIPLHMLNDLDRATHNNAEAMGQQFLTFCILPILKLWCDALAMSLLTEDEREILYFEFLVDDLARAEILKRFEAYGKAIDSGVLNPNEARGMENRAGYPGGEVYGRSRNYAPTDVFNNPDAGNGADTMGGGA